MITDLRWYSYTAIKMNVRLFIIVRGLNLANILKTKNIYPTYYMKRGESLQFKKEDCTYVWFIKFFRK